MKQLAVLACAMLAGCATVYPECAQYIGDERDTCNYEEREYQRVEYLETVLKPKMAACLQHGGYLFLDNPTPALRRAMRTGDFSHLRRAEMIGVRCCTGSLYACGVL